MIVSQSQGNLMMSQSCFNIDYNYTYETLNISFYVVNISSIGQKTIMTGSGICALQTEFYEVSVDKTFKEVSNFNITFTTQNSNSWYVLFNSSLYIAGLDEAEGLNLDCNDSKQTVSITYNEPLIPYFEEVNVFFRIIDIKAQIGPGWIEQPD